MKLGIREKTIIIYLLLFLIFLVFAGANDLGILTPVPTILLALTATSVAVWISLRWLIDPIRKITAGAREIAEGNLDREIRNYSDDELGDLADSINFMAERLKATIDDITEEKNRAQAMLDSMGDGVIALDTSGRVILVNPAAEEFFGIRQSDCKGKDILEVVRDYNLDKLLQKALETSQPMVREMRILTPDQERVFCVNVTPLVCPECRIERGGIIALMRDITERRMLEEMRSEFITNVSHELRTPLTSIKGYLETLLDGALTDPETTRHFLEVMNSETERFTRLIDDLLNLSSVENRRAVINCTQPVKLPELINKVVTMYKAKAEGKNIALNIDIRDNLGVENFSGLDGKENLVVQGDPDMLSQVLINLIDNAVKYTPEGGAVTIRCFGSEEEVTLEVEDTGIGIPKESLPRVFERFYRVDKSRWRERGGTGLGLAIVKHIVEVHGGSVSVKSKVGKGSKFIVQLPMRVQKV